jgi:Ca2+-binding RTX toxin-like protein
MSGADTLNGGGGNDTLDGGTGNDVLSGGMGDDVYIVDSLNDVISEAALAGTDTVSTGSVAWVLGANFENLTLTGTISIGGTGNTLANVITGNSGANALNGDAGNDSLYGGLGADILTGGTGDDSMVGGDGNDAYFVDALGDSVVETVTGGVDKVTASISYTLADTLENLTLTGLANIDGTGTAAINVMFGNDGNNLLSGLAGADTLFGGAGNDTLNGGADIDSMSGGLGDDLYYVDNVADKLNEYSAQGTDTVVSTVTYTILSAFENLTLAGSANVNGIGNAVNNTLIGNSGNNLLSGSGGDDILTGGLGNDTLDGGIGNDVMTGGGGNDTYVVSAATDIISEAASADIDTVQSAISYVLGATLENLQLTGTSALAGTGNSADNRLTGNTGANTLKGLLGDDTLLGGGGNDSLTGGGGADHFVFNAVLSGIDTITDFNAVEGGLAEGDVLEFVGLLTGTFAYVGAGAFSGGSDNTEARISAGTVLMDFDGDGTADMTIKLTGLTTATQLSAGDFLFS